MNSWSIILYNSYNMDKMSETYAFYFDAFFYKDNMDEQI